MDSSDDTDRAPDAILRLDRYIPYQLAMLSHTLARLLQDSYRELGFSVNEWRVLAVIADGRRMTASDIAQRSGINEVAIHRTVKSLLDRQLLHRELDIADRRRKFLSLTPKGWSAYARVVPDALRLERRLLDDLDRDTAKAFRAALDTLHETFVPSGRDGSGD